MEAKSRKTACPNRQLRSVREQRGWSQKSLADLLGTTELTVGRWERGERFPQLFYRARLCEAFGMTAGELGLVKAEMPAEMTGDKASLNMQTVEFSTVPGSPSPQSAVFSLTSKRRGTWSGQKVLFAVVVLSVLGGISGLYLAKPFR